jgi:tetratricopeptide (TPR) repeat protein
MQNLSQNRSAQELVGLLTQAVQALQSGDPAGAEGPARKALSIAPSNPDCLLIMATVSHNLNRLEDAEQYYAASLRLKPDNPRALTNLGHLQLNGGRGAEAVTHLERAVRLDPKVPDARHYLARAYAQSGQLEPAAEQFSALAQGAPGDLEILTGYAQVMTDLKRNTEALELWQRAADLQPDDAKILDRLGTAHAVQGDFDTAETLLRRVIGLKPGDLNAYYRLSAIRRLTEDDMDVLQDSMQEPGDLSKDEHAALLFVMGAHFEETEEYARAFEAVSQANTLLDPDSNYNAQAKEEYFEQLVLATVRDEVEFWPKGHDSAQPVFIVGMPRSGTTLVEQILAAHPSVYAGGEQTTIGEKVVDLMKSDERYTPSVEELDAEQARGLADHYLANLPEASVQYGRVTDKLPGNVQLLPLISRMFPNARIILCRRHPMDVTWSIFKHRFARIMDYSTNLANIAHYQNLTCAFMDHWATEVPERSFEICYELLIADFEAHARKIIDFVGLEWHDACLAPHAVDRSVNTASLWQVRQPVYQTSVGQWSNYDSELAETHALLADLIDGYEAKLDTLRGA